MTINPSKEAETSKTPTDLGRRIFFFFFLRRKREKKRRRKGRREEEEEIRSGGERGKRGIRGKLVMAEFLHWFRINKKKVENGGAKEEEL